MERWFLKQKYGDPQIISRRFGISPLAARLILNRGAVDAEAFRRYLKADESCFHAPERLKDAEKLCSLLAEGIESGKKIRIIGDYDVDGITST